MSKSRSGRNGGFGNYLSEAFHQSLDHTRGGSGRSPGFAEALTQSMANQVMGGSNNRPGSEFMRRGWGTNTAGMMTQEWSNQIVNGWGAKKKPRW